MSPSAERLLRPLLAFFTLCLAAFLLAPTVASVHQKVEALGIQRELPWHIWEWYHEPSPPRPFDCGDTPRHLYSEIKEWPDEIRKDKEFTLRGFVGSEEDGRLGVGDIEVDVFLNESKPDPGVFLGEATTDPNGGFSLTSSIPFHLQASHYHIVAHAKGERIGCVMYREHWSDPEVDVVSNSTIHLELTTLLVAGRETNITGRLVDIVEGPIVNASLDVTIAGKKTNVTTDANGRFVVAHTPEEPGGLKVIAEFEGNRYYDASRRETTFEVAEEAVEIPGAPFVVGRSDQTTIGGSVYVASDRREENVTLRFIGVRAATCLTCEPVEAFDVPLAPDGSFALTFYVPPSEPAGAHAIEVAGGGLEEPHRVDLTVEVPTTLALEAGATSLFQKGYEARATLVDEAGRPISGAPLAIYGPDGWHAGEADADGVFSVAGSAPCGKHPTDVRYNGTAYVRPSSASAEAPSCAFLAYVPAWLLVVPWWIWPLALAAGIASWRFVRAWRQVHAPVILGGPALTLTFTEPADDAAGYASVGETVVATAFLEEPLPDGHRLRMGVHRANEEVPIDAELRAHLRLTPDKLGETTLRADVVNAKGRVVSRRSLALRIVRYPHEIERRYLTLRHASGASVAVTPREFERWLHERAPGLDGATVRRLVQLFEETDYSPRVAGRADFAAYLMAERGVQEVTPDALA